MNKIFLLGYLGCDPTLSYTNNQTAVVKFTIATNDGTQEKPKTNWHNIVVFGKIAENCNIYLQKGSRVLVEGSLQTREYVDKNQVKKIFYDIIATHVKFIDKIETIKHDNEKPSKDEKYKELMPNLTKQVEERQIREKDDNLPYYKESVKKDFTDDDIPF